MPLTLKKILESMKRLEHTQTLVKASYVQQNDEGLWKYLNETFPDQASSFEKGVFLVDAELHKLVKVEDWFKDGSTMKRTVKKGKGSQPNTDSVVKGNSSNLNDFNPFHSLYENHSERRDET